MEWEQYLVSKTPKEDFDRFEKFIDGMENIEYEYWYNFEATKKQRKLADEIREEVSEEEALEGLRPWNTQNLKTSIIASRYWN